MVKHLWNTRTITIAANISGVTANLSYSNDQQPGLELQLGLLRRQWHSVIFLHNNHLLSTFKPRQKGFIVKLLYNILYINSTIKKDLQAWTELSYSGVPESLQMAFHFTKIHNFLWVLHQQQLFLQIFQSHICSSCSK